MKVLPWIIALVFCILFFVTLQREDPADDVALRTETDTMWLPGDSIPADTEYLLGEPLIFWDDSIIYLDTEVDTMAILADYLARLVYTDTIRNDSSALIVVKDTITRNRIISRQVSFQNRRQTSVIFNTTNITYENIGVFGGMMAIGNSGRFGIGPAVLLVHNQSAYSLGFDLLNKDVQFMISRRIWKPRKIP